jgi:hypothetical protein
MRGYFNFPEEFDKHYRLSYYDMKKTLFDNPNLCIKVIKHCEKNSNNNFHQNNKNWNEIIKKIKHKEYKFGYGPYPQFFANNSITIDLLGHAVDGHQALFISDDLFVECYKKTLRENKLNRILKEVPKN